MLVCLNVHFNYKPISLSNSHHVVKVGTDLYAVPVEAFKQNNPYPLGIDPVSDALTSTSTSS